MIYGKLLDDAVTCQAEEAVCQDVMGFGTKD